jgi:hypothetical protein
MKTNETKTAAETKVEPPALHDEAPKTRTILTLEGPLVLPEAQETAPDVETDTKLRKESFPDRLLELLGGKITSVVAKEGADTLEPVYGLQIRLERSQANPITVIAWINDAPNTGTTGYLTIEEDAHA